ncbi:hypothetical protein OAG77_01605, partial [bacterium]|nr:hypothetical protein [bacterium]
MALMAAAPIGCCIARANRGSFESFMRTVWIISLCLCMGSVLSSAQNRVLSLDGQGAHVQMADGLFEHLDEGTVEFWVKWGDLGNYSPALILGENGRCLGFNHAGRSSDLQFFLYDSNRVIHVIKVPRIIKIQQWMHLAGVFGPKGMKLYLNGILVGENEYRGGFGLFSENSPSSVGKADHPDNQPFSGMIDEIRIWSRALNPSELSSQSMPGALDVQTGLVGYWNFDRGDVSDETLFKKHGELIENALCVPVEVPEISSIAKPTFAIGRVLDQAGNPVSGARVGVYRDGHHVGGESGGSIADSTGHFKFWCLLSDQTYDVHATTGNQSDWNTGMTLESLAQPLVFRLRPISQITGTLRALDGSGHAFELIQAVRDGVVVGTGVTDQQGRYALTDLPPGSYRIRTEGPIGFSYSVLESVGTIDSAENKEGDLVDLAVGESKADLNFQFTPFKKGHWTRFGNFESGLALGRISSIGPANDGSLWFLSNVAGLCRFNGRRFSNFTATDGLSSGRISAMALDPSGLPLVGSTDGFIYQLNGDGRFQKMNGTAGRLGHTISALLRDSNGVLWIGGIKGEGLWQPYNSKTGLRFDGLRFERLEDIKNVLTWHEDSKHGLWAGTQADGVYRHFDSRWTKFDKSDGLPGLMIQCMASDNQGFLWIGTNSGLGRYDGESFRSYGLNEGLGNLDIEAIHADKEGALWLGTGGGLVRFDGSHFVHYGQMADVDSPRVTSVYRDSSGLVWCGTDQDGLFRFDPDSSARFGTPDGLLDPDATAVAHDVEGRLFVGTEGGGIYGLRDGGFRPVEGNEALIDRRISGMKLSSSGELWSAVEGIAALAISSIEKNSLEFLNPRLAVLPLPDDVLWSSGKSSITVTESDPAGVNRGAGFQLSEVHSLAIDHHGDVWFGRKGQGIAVFHDGLFHRLTIEQGLISDWVETLHTAADGAVWVGTQGGLSRFESSDNTFPKESVTTTALPPLTNRTENVPWSEQNLIHGAWTNYSSRDGLAHDWVKAIHEDSRGMIWVATNGRGVSRFDGENWTSLDVYDGLSDNYVTSIAEDALGDMWFGTRHGVCRYRSQVSIPRLEILSVETDRVASVNSEDE